MPPPAPDPPAHGRGLAPPPHPAFSGWRVCAVGVVTQALAIGFTLGAVGLFAAPLAEELGATATQFNLAVSLFTVVMNLSMPLIGRALDRGSIARVMTVGALVLAASLAILSRATALWQVGLLFGGGCAVGMAMLGPMSSSTAMASWFTRLRGRALGITNAGGPLGPALIVPPAALAIGAFGWRTTLLGFAVLTLVVGLPAIRLFMIDRPADVGQFPDGDAPARSPVSESRHASAAGATPGESEATQPPGIASPWTPGRIARCGDFWLVALGVAPFAAAGLVMAANAIPYVMHLGASTEAASLVVLIQSSAAVAGPLVFGALADRIHPRRLFLGLIATIALALGALILEPGYALSLVVFGVLGLVGGSMMPVYGALVGRLFGADAFGQVIGLGALVGLPMLFLGPLGFGLAFDASGDYGSGLAGLIAALGTGGVLLALLPSGTARGPRVAVAGAAA